jgi:hypothetical protein
VRKKAHRRDQAADNRDMPIGSVGSNPTPNVGGAQPATPAQPASTATPAAAPTASAPSTTIAGGLAATAPQATAGSDKSGAELAKKIAKATKDVKAADILTKPSAQTSTSVTYKLGGRVLNPGEALYFAVPEQLRGRPVSFAILGHRANPSADTDPNKGDKYDDTPALSSVQVYSAGFPEKEAWRFWLGSSSGSKGAKFAEVGYSMEMENLYEWPKMGSGAVHQGSSSKKPVLPQAFRIVSEGDDPVEIGEITLKVVPEKPTKTLEATFSAGTHFGDWETGAGRKYGGGQSFQGLFPGALELGGWGSAGGAGAAKLPEGMKLAGSQLEIALVPGARVTAVEVACGDSHPDKITNSDGGYGTKGWAKLSIGLQRAGGQTDWFMSSENVPPEGVMGGSPTDGAYVAKAGDKVVVRASSDTVYVMAVRVGLKET